MKLRSKDLNLWPSSWLATIKEKILNFDIKPARPIIDELLQQADHAFQANNNILAAKILRKILRLNNTNYHALYLSMNVYYVLGWQKPMLTLLKHAIRHYPKEAIFYEMLGFVYAQRGRLATGAKYYRQALRLNPGAMNIKHFLDATLQHNTPSAPRDYIVNLFDDYAERFEHNLVETLGYQAHIKLVAYMRETVQTQEPINKVLDLGCGTGLLGRELAQQFNIQHLEGVDLAGKMLAKAQAKNIYHALHNAEIVEFLRNARPGVDMVVSSDVFIYLGDLSQIFAQCHRILKAGGYFGFTVEKHAWGKYKLTTTGRYKHSLPYLKSLYKRYQFSKMYSQTIDLRLESGNMVAGYLVLLQK